MDQSDSDKLVRRLSGYGLGIGAVAAGLCLPEKAEGAIQYEAFIGVTVDCDGGFLNLRFQDQTGLVACGGCGCDYGFNFAFFESTACTSAGFYFIGSANYGGCGTGCYSASYYYILQSQGQCEAYTWTACNSSINLAGIDTNNFFWGCTAWDYVSMTAGQPLIVGLRMKDGTGSYYGWAELEYGSLTLNQSGFEDTDGGSISPGQIPEPGSLALLLAGAAGVSALRRKRGSSVAP